MGTPVGLLAGLLVFALGSGVVAQSPSPEATPPYAPDDLTFVLPAQVGDIPLTVAARDGDYLTTLMDADDLRQLLIPLGREPEDVRMAVALSAADPLNRVGLQLMSVRVDGVEAEPWVEPLFQAMFPPGMPTEWVEVAGRRVFVVAGGDAEAWAVFYPKGEAVFLALYAGDAAAITIEDVLAELP